MPGSASTPILQVLQPYLWPGGIALAMTIIATPVVRSIALRGGIMDMPDTRLKPHARPIPYLGGVAIYLGWAAAIVTTLWIGPAFDERSKSMLKYILAAGT